MNPAAPLDVVIYGATGYTGQLVAEVFARNASGARWAMAGRSMDKLANTRDAIGAPADTPLIVADSSDPASLKAMAEQAKVVITTVGPYQLYGSPLVEACAATGADYVDLCGEVGWMRAMIDAHEAGAKASGARIVFSCGFDSVPFDYGVWFLQEEAKRRFGAPVQTVNGRVRVMKGTFSGGTAASLKATMAAASKDPGLVALLRNPFALTPGFEGPAQPHGAKPMYDEALQSWLAPFIMAPINTRNVHRSNYLLGHAYGPSFVYDEMLMTGPGEKGEMVAKMVAGDTSLMGEDAPKPGEGPTKAEREAGHYDVAFFGSDPSGASLRVGVTGDRDPGYGSTSKMIAACALTLINDRTDLAGGIYTPAAALGQPGLDRLVADAGLTFAVEA